MYIWRMGFFNFIWGIFYLITYLFISYMIKAHVEELLFMDQYYWSIIVISR